ncbi:MAG: hypothetical protein WB245_09375 [Acidimicrobiia bacterium]
MSFEARADALNEVKRSDFARASEADVGRHEPDFGIVEQVEVP